MKNREQNTHCFDATYSVRGHLIAASATFYRLTRILLDERR